MLINKPAKPQWSCRGFSLLELMVSIGIMSIVFSFASQQVVMINKLSRKIENKVQTHEDATLTTQYLANQLREAGGANLRPYMAIWLEDNCAGRDGLPSCDGSDRVTLNQVDNSIDACPVTIAENPARLHFNNVNSRCCSSDVHNKQIVVIKDSAFSYYYVKTVHENAPTNECWIDVEEGQSYGLNNINPMPAFTGWSNSTMLLVDAKTIFVDRETKELKLFTDLNNNQEPEEDEIILLSDQITDMQVILGYDAAPQNGTIDNTNDENDEWLYNYSTVNEALGAGGLTDATVQDLRMAGIGVISESFLSNANGSAQLFNGPNRENANAQMEVMQTRIYFRSTLIFNN